MRSVTQSQRTSGEMRPPVGEFVCVWGGGGTCVCMHACKSVVCAQMHVEARN